MRTRNDMKTMKAYRNNTQGARRTSSVPPLGNRISSIESEVRTVMGGIWKNEFTRMALLSVLALVMVFGAIGVADAAMSTLSQFQAAPCSTGSTSPQTCTGITLPAGSDRMLVVAVGGYISNTGTASTFVNASFGGLPNAISIVEGWLAGRRFGWIGYVPESQLATLTAGNNYTLSVDVIPGGALTLTGFHVNYAFYSGVDQTGGTTSFPSTGTAYINAIACSVPLNTVPAGSSIVYALGGTNADMTYAGPSHTTRWDNFATIDTYGMSEDNVAGGAETMTVTPNNRAGCAAAVIAPNPCSETATVSLDAVPNPITGATAITATIGGTGGSGAQVRWRTDGGAWSGWQASGSTYTPPGSSTGTADFEAQATGSCGTITDPANPTSTNYDTTCTESTTSSIIWNGVTTANGDFSGSTLANLTDVNTPIECKVTEGSGGGAPYDQIETFDNNDTTCDYSANWVADTPDSCGTNVASANQTISTHTGAAAQDNADGTHTGSAGVGPTSLYSGTHGSNGGFIYVEASGGTYPEGPYYFTRVPFDSDAYELNISFAFAANTAADTGTLTLQARNANYNGGAWTPEWQQVNNDGNGGAWTFVNINLFAGGGLSGTAYVAGTTELRFEWAALSNWGSDMALDSIRVFGPAQAAEVTVIDWNADPMEANGVLTDSNTYNIYCRATDAECGGTVYYGDPAVSNTTPDGVSKTFTWSSCADTASVSLDTPLPGTIASSYTATATLGGTGGSNPEIRWSNDGGAWSSWYAMPQSYTAPGPNLTGTVAFEVRATGSCGYIFDPNNGQPNHQTNYDTNGPQYSISCGACHTNPPADGTRSGVSGAVVGSHSITQHTSGNCSDCHVEPSTNNHRNGNIEMASPIHGQGTSYYDKNKNSSHTAADDVFAQVNSPVVLGNCQNTYCHSRGAGGTLNVGEDRLIEAGTSPNWGGSIANCDGCHGQEGGATDGQPRYANGTNIGGGTVKANSHASHTTDCSVCHNATTTDGTTITDPALHGNRIYNLQAKAGYSFAYNFAATGGQCASISCHGGGTHTWNGPGPGCVDCHNAAISSPVAQALDTSVTQRRAIVPEFKMTWSHKADTNTTPANRTVVNGDCIVCHMEGLKATLKTDPAYHGNGYVELRDPDLGTTIKTVTFSGTPGSFSPTATDARFVRFSRDLDIRFELDPYFSIVAAIQINQCLKCHDNLGATDPEAQIAGGNALRPFNTTPNHTPGTNVLDVNSSFATNNSSYHPVRGKQNNSYADSDTMVAPYNQSPKAAGVTNEWGDLISCWDCHAPTGALGIQTSTVTAHGGSVTLRGTIYTQAPTLCTACHQSADYVSQPGHATGSAFSTTSGDMNNANIMQNCHNCHAANTADPRPTRAASVHGFTGTWGTGNTQYAFIRNTQTLTNHAPASPVTSGGARNCTGMIGSVNGCGSGSRTQTYSVGGVY